MNKQSSIEEIQEEGRKPLYSPRIQPDMLQQTREKRLSRNASQYIPKTRYPIAAPFPIRFKALSFTLTGQYQRILKFTHNRVALIISALSVNSIILSFINNPASGVSNELLLSGPFNPNNYTFFDKEIMCDELWATKSGGTAILNVFEGIPYDGG